MRYLFNHVSRRNLALFFCCAIIFSLIYSPFVLSVGMILICVMAVFDIWEAESGKLKFGLNKSLKNNFQQFLQAPQYWILSFFFLIVFVGGLYNEDWTYWLERLRIKVPFLLLPFAFFSLPTFRKKDYLGLYYFLVILLFFTSIGIGINYLMNFEAINESILKGHAVPVPRNHIRYSLMMAIGIIAGAYLYKEKFKLRYDWERPLIAFMTLFLFLFIHVLAVRSGLLVLYFSLIVLAVFFIFQSRKYVKGLLLIASIILLPIIAYKTIPSFKAKVAYTVWDMKMFEEGTGDNYSDSNRLFSLQMGLDIFKEHPIIGVGAGDLRKEVKERTVALGRDVAQHKMPHNQILSILAASGIVGGILFLITFFFPLFYAKAFLNPLHLSLHTIIFFSFMMENTLETSIGLGIYIFFLLIGLHYERMNSSFKNLRHIAPHSFILFLFLLNSAEIDIQIPHLLFF